jgi:hypothetical protein
MVTGASCDLLGSQRLSCGWMLYRVFLCAEVASYRVTRSHPCLAGFSGPLWSSLDAVISSSIEEPIILSWAFPPLQSSYSPVAAQRHAQATSSGSSSPSRRQRTESTQQRASHARLRSALSVSHTLDGLLLCAPCRLVSSRCHVRDSRVVSSLGLASAYLGNRLRVSSAHGLCRWRYVSTRRFPFSVSIDMWPASPSLGWRPVRGSWPAEAKADAL